MNTEKVKKIIAERYPLIKSSMSDCRLCPRDCRVNRLKCEKGYCGAGHDVEFFMNYVHYGEEPELVPSNAVYLTGCNMDCIFCHTYDERVRLKSVRLNSDILEDIIKKGISESARNINILGGEPMVNLPGILRLLMEMNQIPELVWNTNLYCSEKALELIFGIPDVYLVDFKFGNAECARRLSDTHDYWEIIRSRLKILDSVEKGKVIIRHLLMPGHLDCCTRPILEWIARELSGSRLSLKTDYIVTKRACQRKDLGKFFNQRDAEGIISLARDLNIRLVNGERGAFSSKHVISGISSDTLKRNLKKNFDIEFIISPQGQIYLRHPNLVATRLIQGLVTDKVGPEE